MNAQPPPPRPGGEDSAQKRPLDYRPATADRMSAGAVLQSIGGFITGLWLGVMMTGFIGRPIVKRFVGTGPGLNSEGPFAGWGVATKPAWGFALGFGLVGIVALGAILYFSIIRRRPLLLLGLFLGIGLASLLTGVCFVSP